MSGEVLGKPVQVAVEGFGVGLGLPGVNGPNWRIILGRAGVRGMRDLEEGIAVDASFCGDLVEAFVDRAVAEMELLGDFLDRKSLVV